MLWRREREFRPRKLLLPAEVFWSPVFASLVTTSSMRKPFESRPHLLAQMFPPQNRKNTSIHWCFFYFAERARFELARPVRVRRFSKPLVSATHPSLHIFTIVQMEPLKRFDELVARCFLIIAPIQEKAVSLFIHLTHLSITSIKITLFEKYGKILRTLSFNKFLSLPV